MIVRYLFVYIIINDLQQNSWSQNNSGKHLKCFVLFSVSQSIEFLPQNHRLANTISLVSRFHDGYGIFYGILKASIPV